MRTLVTPLALGVLTLVACDDESIVSPNEPESTDIAVTNIESLVNYLRDAGMTVEEEGEATAFFPIRGTILLVNDGRVGVYKYGDEASAEGKAARISPDGFQAKVTADVWRAVSMVEWIATPHFYRKGRLIALYVVD